LYANREKRDPIKAMRILIVDDSHFNRYYLESILRDEGYQNIVSADSAKNAYQVLDLESTDVDSIPKVDLILMDNIMPDVDGIQACREIKNHQRLKDIPIIIVTAILEEMEVAFAAGAIDYITKPYRKSELLARVGSSLRIKYDMNERKERESRIKKDLSIAKLIQKSVLSPAISNEQVKINAKYVPSDEVSGDMYFWGQIDEHRYAVFIMDVAGHGISSALVSMSLRPILNRLIKETSDPVKIMSELNHYVTGLYQYSEGYRFITGIYLLLDIQLQTIEFVNAGHPPGLVIFQDNTIQYLKRTCIPIGVQSEIHVEKGQISYEKPIRIVLYTDGLVEIPNRSISLCIEELITEILELKSIENDRFVEQIVLPRMDRKSKDDICMISIVAF
jgi:sigma-B regulation protein RsbU (phosphoserine phosphatase)